MDWCGSSTPKTPEYQPINKKDMKKKEYRLVLVIVCEALILEDISIYDIFSRIRAVKFVLSNN